MISDDFLVKEVIVAAIRAKGDSGNISDIIKETVDALIAADRVLHAYVIDQKQSTFVAR